MTSGGYRSVAPAETVARFRKHVSPLTGVVSQLERIKSEQPLDASFLARHNFSPRPETVDAPQAGLSGDSYGKGSTAEQGEASALMEAIERYCGIFQGNEIRTTRRFVDFPAGDAILPNDILLLSDAQHEHGLDGASSSGDGCCAASIPRPRRNGRRSGPCATSVSNTFRPASCIFFTRLPATNQISADSNGCAAGNTLEEAIIQGFLELVERDAYAIWWYNRLQRAEVDLDKLGDNYIRDLRAHFAAMGHGLWVLDVTSDLGIPVVIAVVALDGRTRGNISSSRPARTSICGSRRYER